MVEEQTLENPNPWTVKEWLALVLAGPVLVIVIVGFFVVFAPLFEGGSDIPYHRGEIVNADICEASDMVADPSGKCLKLLNNRIEWVCDVRWSVVGEYRVLYCEEA